jgi:hypothetical protein
MLRPVTDEVAPRSDSIGGLQRRSMRVRYPQHDGTDIMITTPIVHPKAAILASLLIGALAIAASMLRPHTGQQPAEQSAFGHRGASSASAPDSPHPAALASGRVSIQYQADAAVAQALEAVRESLRRNDLASARVLLDAEQLLHEHDPRIMALQRELQAREEASGQVLAIEPTVATPAPSRSSRSATRYAARAEHTHRASSQIRERASSLPESADSGHAPQAEAAANPVVTRDTPSPVPTNPEMDLSALRMAPSAAEARSPSQSGALTPPLTQAAQSAQADPAGTPSPDTSSQAPKTRAEVRDEVEQARANGALPRFGNPDPAGPGGAPSRVSHAVVLDW